MGPKSGKAYVSGGHVMAKWGTGDIAWGHESIGA